MISVYKTDADGRKIIIPLSTKRFLALVFAIPAHVQRHHFLVEHVHESAGRGDDHVDAFTPDDIRLLLGRHPADGQNGPQLRIAVVLQLVADQVDIFARLLRQFSKWRERKPTGQKTVRSQ